MLIIIILNWPSHPHFGSLQRNFLIHKIYCLTIIQPLIDTIEGQCSRHCARRKAGLSQRRIPVSRVYNPLLTDKSNQIIYMNLFWQNVKCERTYTSPSGLPKATHKPTTTNYPKVSRSFWFGSWQLEKNNILSNS